MSLPRARQHYKAAFAALALASITVLAGCTLTPVHGGNSASSQAALSLSYDAPRTRLEQIVYQTLSARLERNGAGAPHFSASVSVSDRSIGISDVASPVEERQITANVTYEVTQGAQILATGARQAVAAYQTTGQIIADDAARAAAEELAVRAAAEAVRLALLGQFAPS